MTGAGGGGNGGGLGLEGLEGLDPTRSQVHGVRHCGGSLL